jgi:nucleoside-diphosphate kinase
MEHPKQERTLVIIKPDGVQRGLIGEVIKRYERTGLKLVGLKLVVPTGDLIEKHYLVDPDWKVKRGKKTIQAYKDKGLEPPITDPEKSGQATLDVLKKYFASGPVVVMVWQGMNAVAVVKKITGGTEPLTSDVGTIRGDLTIDSFQVADIDGRSARNIIHASGNLEDAVKEIPLWFSEQEIFNYRLINEAILYDVNLDGILE